MDSEILQEFLAEMAETLDAVDLQLVLFEAAPTDRTELDGVFRLMHTLKGTSGFIGLPRMEAIAHAGEDLLDLIRDGEQAATGEAVTLVLRCVDRVKWLVDELARTGAEAPGDDFELIEEISSFASVGGADPPNTALTDTTPTAADHLDADPADTDQVDLDQVDLGGPSLRVMDGGPPPSAPEASPAASAAPDIAAGPGTIRVSVDLLESLMTVVTDLVLTRNQLLQLSRSRADESYSNPLQRLSNITSEVQDTVMRMRMQPIGAAWKKLPRLVRDLCTDLGKDVRLVMEGEAAELDRQVLESIKDPITHMVRNAIDHGLETPDVRVAAGKPAAGTLTLSASHQGGYIIIRIADDGRGLNTDAIRAKAVEKGVLSQEAADALSEADVHRLIFASGFSTAAAVTNLSGRGVGMDVVRANIEQIGGQVDLVSMPGQGAVISLRIPLTLAIISALIVRADGRRFAAPQAGVSEVVRVGPLAARRLEVIEGAMLLSLRETLLPVVSLSASLGLDPGQAQGFVLVMHTGARRFGLLVDQVLDTEEIVVKPLPVALRNIRPLSGATMLGDGSVALILDCDALGDLAKPVETAPQAADDAATEIQDARRQLLLFRAGPGPLKAVELALVTRLERVMSSDIEQPGPQAVLQLRGELAPVVTLDGAPAPLAACPRVQPLIILASAEGPVALAVEEIVDVVEDRLQIELLVDAPGVLGAAVVAGVAVQVLDPEWCLAQARPRRRDPEVFVQSGKAAA